MKSVLAALALLLQLQPLLGTAACLGLSRQGPQQECQMPEHGAVPHSTVAQPDSSTPNCALASVCAPTPLAIASLADRLESIITLYTESGNLSAPTLFGISSAPPFDPPRA
jgi:hypothetical protein